MKRDRKGFTLVEILIVVIILGILAAVVIPQFTQASNDARESAMASDLQTVRSQLELYKVQHIERYPDVKEDGTADTANFVARMTGKTTMQGKVDAAGTFGPYLQKFPTNPFLDKNDVLFGAVPCVGGETHGWYFDTNLGKFCPNDAAHKDL